MKNYGLFALLATVLMGCNVTEPPPYQADRAPEDRTMYHGAEGLVQHQKDQAYLMDKERIDKCEAAKLDLVVARQENNDAEIQKNESIIDKSCI